MENVLHITTSWCSVPFLRIPHIIQHSFHISQSMGFNCCCVLQKKEFYWNIHFLSIMSWCLITLIPTTMNYTCDVHRTGLILLSLLKYHLYAANGSLCRLNMTNVNYSTFIMSITWWTKNSKPPFRHFNLFLLTWLHILSYNVLSSWTFPNCMLYPFHFM
jgi:hypothetical protein